MFRQLGVRFRHSLTKLFAGLFRKTFDARAELDYAAIRDYRRIQRIRQAEEEKYRALYMGPRR